MGLKVKGRAHRTGQSNSSGSSIKAASQSHFRQSPAVSDTIGASYISPQSYGGHALSSEQQRFYGQHFYNSRLESAHSNSQTSLSQVRIHHDHNADINARHLQASAFSYGQHIYFQKGAYQPNTLSGKQLLAHELTHTAQNTGNTIHRRCDPALLSTRTTPIFFPQDSTLVNIYNGSANMGKSPARKNAVGLVQQALVDLDYDLGNWGPRKDGVDRIYGTDTSDAVAEFQFHESIPVSGILNQATLKCLDEKRSKLTVPQHQQGTVPSTEFQINTAKKGGRKQDIFFDRGSSTATAESILKILDIALAQKGCQLTLEGYESEDEVNEFGHKLATQRINEVAFWLKFFDHHQPGKCNPAQSPIVVPKPLPTVSSGVGNYRSRRKVEIVFKNATSTTAPCPTGAAQTQPLTATEKPVLKKSADDASKYINQALGKLKRGNSAGDAALKAYFGTTGYRSRVRKNLTTWRNHIDGPLRTKNRRGTDCLSSCRTAIAFNQGTGGSSMMTLCGRYFSGSFNIPQELSNKQEKQAFVILHEAGHGSINTKDYGYGHRRLVEFLASQRKLALRNTDSYTRLVFCLSGHNAFCAPRVPSGDVIDKSKINTTADQEEVRRGLAWLESWLQWTGQNVSGAYKTLEKSRRTGKWSNSTYQKRVFIPFTKVFDLHRPSTSALPTFAEQRYMAAVLDRYLLMRKAAAEGVKVTTDTTLRWGAGNPGPKKKLFVDSAYLKLTRDRQRVERLLPLIIAATGSIDASMRSKYETFTKQDVRRNWSNAPK